jgi:hypothetical protein
LPPNTLLVPRPITPVLPKPQFARCT